MIHRVYRLFVFALMLAFVMSGMNLTASAYTNWQNNSFTLFNEADASIIEVYIFPSSGGRGQPRNYTWIHSGSSTVINFTDSDLNSRTSWSMTAGFKSRTGVYTVRWDNLRPTDLVAAKDVTITLNTRGEYVLDYSKPYADPTINYPMPPSITECIEKGRLDVNASSWFRGNNPSVHPSKMMDGNIMTSWDSDDESHPDFWFTATDGNEYTVSGIRIVNGKYNEYYYYRNGRVAKLDMYVDGEYVTTFSVNDERGVYQTVWFDVPVSGTEFYFHVSYIYRGTHETREDLCISEFELF